MEPERFVRTTENRIRHFARTQGLWIRGDRVVLAVSGGADSLCMLYVMARVARLDALSLVTAHLNHGMRGAHADDDQAFVASQAEMLGVPFVAGYTDVPAFARTARIGLEDAGRRARREFLDRVIAETDAASAATAHTRSDHVETVLLHLFRGSGLQGLTGIRPRSDLRGEPQDGERGGQRGGQTGGHRRIRPLLCLWREETEAFCAARGLTPREDPGNYDLSFQRNRLRHVVLPLLRESVNPSVDDAVNRCSTVAAAALDLVEAAGRAVYESMIGRQPGTLLRQPLRAAAPAAAAEAIRLALGSAYGSLEGIHFSDVERVFTLVRAGGRAPLSHGGVVEVSGDELRIRYPRTSEPAGERPAAAGLSSNNTKGTRHPASVPGAAVPGAGVPGAGIAPFQVAIPGVTALPGGGVLVAAVGEPDAPRTGDFATVYARLPLWVRFPLPGDRFRPTPRGGSRKLKDLFVELRVPAWDRSSWPVVLDGSGIVWSPVLGVAEHAASPAEGLAAVTIEWRREAPR